MTRQEQQIRELKGELEDATSHIAKLEEALEKRKQASREMRRRIEEGMRYKKRTQLLITLSLSLNASIIAANLCGLKIWKLYKLPVDGGIFIFPVTYVVGDLLSEFFGQKIANYVAAWIAFTGVLMCGLLKLIAVLPFLQDFPGVDNSAFLVVQSATGRIFLASLCGFFLGQIANNYVFERLRCKLPAKKDFLIRALGSSVPAHIIDALTFEIIAFVGRVEMLDFAFQVVFALAAGLLLEVCVSPITKFLAVRLDPKTEDAHKAAQKLLRKI